MRKVLIHYFSGTGNTYHAVKIIGNNFEQQGYNVNYAYIEKEIISKNISKLNDFYLHIFAYPVYGLGTHALLVDYV